MERRILLIRTDRIGDLISVTPAITVLRKNFPRAYIAVLVSDYAKDVVAGNPLIDEVIIKKPFFTTLKEIKSKNFDTAIIFFLDAYAAFVTFMARIPKRIAPVSKIWAALANIRIKQNRSQSVKHETDYNLDLLKPLSVFFFPVKTQIYVNKKDSAKAQKYLKDVFSVAEKDALVMIHPGSRGSAKDWPAQNFALLTQYITKKHPELKVMLTGGAQEQQMLAKTAAAITPAPLVLKDALELKDFIALINECDIFISNSTGPLHIAAALGKKTLSFFPPLKPATPVRWGPYGKGGHKVLVPDIKICQKCDGKCTVNCMTLIPVGEAETAFELLLMEK